MRATSRSGFEGRRFLNEAQRPRRTTLKAVTAGAIMSLYATMGRSQSMH